MKRYSFRVNGIELNVRTVYTSKSAFSDALKKISNKLLAMGAVRINNKFKNPCFILDGEVISIQNDSRN